MIHLRYPEPDTEVTKRLLLQTYLEVEKEAGEARVLPDVRPDMLSRLRRFLELAGAIGLGLMIASGAVLLIFVLSRMFFHLDLMRYFPF